MFTGLFLKKMNLPANFGQVTTIVYHPYLLTKLLRCIASMYSFPHACKTNHRSCTWGELS